MYRMKFDHKKIEEKLHTFWRENTERMQYFICGKEVFPERISSCSFQLSEVESTEGYNFEVSTLNLRVQIDSMEAAYKADSLIKVIPTMTLENGMPGEEVMGIHSNRIFLRK